MATKYDYLSCVSYKFSFWTWDRIAFVFCIWNLTVYDICNLQGCYYRAIHVICNVKNLCNMLIFWDWISLMMDECVFCESYPNDWQEVVILGDKGCHISWSEQYLAERPRTIIMWPLQTLFNSRFVTVPMAAFSMYSLAGNQ